jgi:ABC-type multidrug transport system ATPase subunit
MEALNEALLEPTNGASRDDDGAAPVKRLEWAGVGVVAGRKRRILSEAGGVAKAGRTLALLGPSGAGKTTLLRCLAGRAEPDAGSVRLVVSGGSTRAARAVFVEQEDVFCPELTAREHLRFRAGLALWRRDRTRAANGRAADARAEELLVTFGLETVADHPRVGAPADARALGGARGLSGGERKRLAVALEVVGAPRVVFADEPTSGLDSQLAASVVRTLARLAKGGAIVVYSIHQPSQRCFDLCDDLVVLAHGKTLYAGPAADAVRTLAPPPDIVTLPPAEAILEVAARDVPAAAPPLVKAPRRFATARAPAPAAPFYARALALAHRGVVTQLRRWPLIVAQFATCAVFASLIGMLYEGDGRPRIDQKGVENVNGYLFMLCTGTLFSSLFPPLQFFFRGLALARREAASGAYGLPLSVLAMQLADIVLQQALPCVFVSVTYRLIDPRHGLEQRLGAFLLVAQAVAFAGASLGYLIACLSPDSECRRPVSSCPSTLRRVDGVEDASLTARFSPRSRDRCGAAVRLPDDPAGRALCKCGRHSGGSEVDQQGVFPSPQLRSAFGSICHTPSTRPVLRTGQPH